MSCEATHDRARWLRVFPGRRYAVSEISRWVADRLDGYPIRDNAALCAAELATNAVKHTDSGRGGTLRIVLTVDRDEIRIEMHDGGAATVPLPMRAGPDDEHGHGLKLVEELGACWGSCGDRAGRMVWCELSWRPEHPLHQPSFMTTP